ncbi:hypothetical protein D3C87_1755230 [compost metagenome]
MRATLRLYFMAKEQMDCTRWTLEAKVDTITRFLAVAKEASRPSSTRRSLGVKPSRVALVESDMRTRTPSSPIWAKRWKSKNCPSTGVWSILKSPV